MAAKPVVNGIEARHSGQLRVAHVDVLDPASRPLMERLGFLATPTFILFDAQGRELWRSVGAIDPLEVDRSLAAP